MEASAAGWSGRCWEWDGFGNRQDLKEEHSLSSPPLADPGGLGQDRQMAGRSLHPRAGSSCPGVL